MPTFSRLGSREALKNVDKASPGLFINANLNLRYLFKIIKSLVEALPEFGRASRNPNVEYLGLRKYNFVQYKYIEP